MLPIKLTKIFILLQIYSTFCNAYERKFLKMENCTSTGRTIMIHICEVKDNKVNARLTVLPSNKNSTNIRVSPSKSTKKNKFAFFYILF